MSQHLKNNGREFGKKGLTVLIKPVHADNAEDYARASAKAVEAAIRTLKRRSINEGLVKDLRKNEFYVSKGERARRRRKDAVSRERSRHMEEISNWDPNAMLGVHQNKKPRRRKRDSENSRNND